jgi:DnaK suppressor protein
MENAGLDDEQLGVLRARLERLQQELQQRLRREQALARESDSITEEVEAAEQTREQDDGILFAGHDRDRLREIERALQKMDNGRYGVSEVSGEPIPYARLLAVPWARTDSDEELFSPSGNR